MRSSLRLVLLCLLGIALSGCLVAPFMEPFRQAGMTTSSRRALLQERMRLFSKVLEGQRFEQAADFAVSDSRASVIQALNDLAGDNYRLTGTKLLKRTDDEDCRASTITVGMERYRVGWNTIEQVTTEQRWVFGSTNGWQIEQLNIRR